MPRKQKHPGRRRGAFLYHVLTCTIARVDGATSARDAAQSFVMTGERYLNVLGATCAVAVLVLAIIYERTGSTDALLGAGGFTLLGLLLEPLWRHAMKRGMRG